MNLLHAGPLQQSSPFPVRVHGYVRISSKAAKGVVVSDGVAVVCTESDGSYELVSDSQREYVFISLPSQTQIPTKSSHIAAFYSSIPSGQNEISIEFELARSAKSEDIHGFLLLADPQIADMDDVARLRTELIPDIISNMNYNNRPEFLMNCGDLVFDAPYLYPHLVESISETTIPSFQIPGNHDVDWIKSGLVPSIESYKSFFGPPYYSFNRGQIHYVALNNVFWIGDSYINYIEQIQLEWLKKDLSFIPAGSRVVVFSHIPIYYDGEKERLFENIKPMNIYDYRDTLYSVLAPFRPIFVCGHFHQIVHYDDKGKQHLVCGSPCGALWTDKICGDGTPNGYMMFEIAGSEISWKYKSTGHPIETQMRLWSCYDTQPNSNKIFANIWDADEKWTVIIYEDGIKKGKMSRIWSIDYLAEKKFRGPSLPAKYPTIEPISTDHFYSASVDDTIQTILVEATDRFGRVYVQHLKLGR